MDAKKIIFGAILIAVGVYYAYVQPNSASHPNAPDGALEYFESGDGNEYVVVFEDAIVVVDEATSIDVEIPLNKIGNVRTTGYILVVNGKDGSRLQVNMPGPQAANRVEDLINELLKQQANSPS